jgi:hypothetical protein
MSPSGNPPLAGIVFRYYMSRSLQPINVFKYALDADWRKQIEALYAKGQSGKANYPDFINPTYVQLNGSITPWYAGSYIFVKPAIQYAVDPGEQTFGVLTQHSRCSCSGDALSASEEKRTDEFLFALFSYAVNRRFISSTGSRNFAGSLSVRSLAHSSRQPGGSCSLKWGT